MWSGCRRQWTPSNRGRGSSWREAAMVRASVPGGKAPKSRRGVNCEGAAHAGSLGVKRLTRIQLKESELDELHLRAGKLDHVAVLQLHRVGRQGRAVDRGPCHAF